MLFSTTKIQGQVSYKLYDEFMNLKDEGVNHNLVVTEGLQWLADRVLTSPAYAQMDQLVLGTGTATPAAGDTWVSGPFGNNGAAAGTAGSVTPGTIAGSANSFRFVGTFGAGYATQNGINEAIVTNTTPGTAGTDPGNGLLLAHALLSPGTINKGTADTLVITWDFTFSAA